jgi:geranylgeranyl reductase
METVDVVVTGAGPAGLRAAQVLAESGREVVVLEKQEVVGSKTCAGGLTLKSVRELTALGVPVGSGTYAEMDAPVVAGAGDLTGRIDSAGRVGSAAGGEAGRPGAEGGETGAFDAEKLGLPFLTQISFRGEPLVPLDPLHGVVHTIARRELGRWQARLAVGAGAEVRTGVTAVRIDLVARTLIAGGRKIRYRHLIGADGATSAVRRALGLPARRDFFAGEFNIPGLRSDALIATCDSRELAGGYFWIFPHIGYTSVGAMVHKGSIAPVRVRPYLSRRMAEFGIEPGSTPFEGATIETEHRGVEFPGSVYLVGDAAGLASALSGEGIYGALISGEEVAQSILEPGYPRLKLKSWLRSKRVQDTVAGIWRYRALRGASFAVLPLLCRQRDARRWLSELLLRH